MWNEKWEITKFGDEKDVVFPATFETFVRKTNSWNTSCHFCFVSWNKILDTQPISHTLTLPWIDMHAYERCKIFF